MTEKLDKLVKEAEKFAVEGNWKLAFDRLADAHKMVPQELNILTGLAHCAIQLGQKEEALTFLEQAVLLAPDSADVHCSLGVIQALLGRLEEAEGSYQMAITLDPDKDQPWKNLAMLYIGEYDETADKSTPAQKARLASMAGEGVQILHAVVQADPGDTDGWYLLGRCYEKIGDIISAKALYEKVLSLNPDYIMATQSVERINAVLPVEAETALPPPIDIDRIARPEHAKKLAGLKGLAPKGVAAPQTPDKAKIAIYGPAELASEMRLSPPARALYQDGFQVKLSLRMEGDDLQTNQIFVFANPHYSPELSESARQALQSRKDYPGRRVVIDLDQDFYSLPAGAPQKMKQGPGSKQALETLASLMKEADLVSVPCEALVDVYKKSKAHIEVIPHSWDRADILWDKPAPKRKTLNLGVVSTHTLREDAAVLAGPIKRLLAEEKDLMLVVGGDISLAEAFGEIDDDTKMFVPFGQVKDYPYLLANFDILLLPYQANDYNQHRADNSLLEAGIRRIPWIATSNPAFRAWGAGGLFLEKEQDWYDTLKKVVRDPKLRTDLGNAGRRKAEEREAEKIMPRWREILIG